MRGFTLIEGLIAMFILTVVFFAAIGLYPSSVMANVRAGEQLKGNSIALRVLENARMEDFSRVAVGDRTLLDQTIEGVVFHIQESIQAPAPDVKQIQVTVSWMGHTVESVTCQTAIFNYEGSKP